LDTAYEERGISVVSGAVNIGSNRFPSGQLLVLRPGVITARNADDQVTRLALVGGETMDGPRYIWRNFVSSRRDRIEQAKIDWRAGSFDTVPGRWATVLPYEYHSLLGGTRFSLT